MTSVYGVTFIGARA